MRIGFVHPVDVACVGPEIPMKMNCLLKIVISAAVNVCLCSNLLENLDYPL